MMLFGPKGAYSVLMLVTNSTLSNDLNSSRPIPETAGSMGVPGSNGPLPRSFVVYIDDFLCSSPTLKQQLLPGRNRLSAEYMAEK